MVNLFFVRERCPLSLSLAGYLMNKGEICIEILDDVQVIINSDDVTGLCHGAANVDAIIKTHKAQRIFVQDNSKNLSAVTLASLLNGLDVYLVVTENTSQILQPSMLNAFVKPLIPTRSKQNFFNSGYLNETAEKVTDEELTLVTSMFPPKSDWFYEYYYYLVKPDNLYSHNNYSLPNYVAEGTIIGSQKRAEALKICQFFKSEANSTWKIFEIQIFSGGEKI